MAKNTERSILEVFRNDWLPFLSLLVGLGALAIGVFGITIPLQEVKSQQKAAQELRLLEENARVDSIVHASKYVVSALNKLALGDLLTHIPQLQPGNTEIPDATIAEAKRIAGSVCDKLYEDALLNSMIHSGIIFTDPQPDSVYAWISHHCAIATGWRSETESEYTTMRNHQRVIEFFWILGYFFERNGCNRQDLWTAREDTLIDQEGYRIMKESSAKEVSTCDDG